MLSQSSSLVQLQSGSPMSLATQSIADPIRKEEILRSYPPNLSQFQEIGFGRKVQTESGEWIEKRVRPDVHFRGEDGKEQLVFYNNHIVQLKELISDKLDCELEEHSFLLYTLKDGILKNSRKAKMGALNVTPTISSLFKVYLSFPIAIGVRIAGAVIDDYSAAQQKAMFLSSLCSNLNYAGQHYGIQLDGSDSVCTVFVDRDLKQLITLEKQDAYSTVEKEYSQLMSSRLSDRETVLAMNGLLDRYKVEWKPRASDMDAVHFCFPLNRTSYYLARLEKDLQHKDLPTLEAMYELRKKVNCLTLEYRFMMAENTMPILEIRIDRCKILVETEAMTMMFLDRSEIQKFQTELEKELDRKASNITGKFDFKPLTGAELRSLANDLKPESYQGMLDLMDRKLVDMGAERDIQICRSAASCAKVAIKTNGKDLQLTVQGGFPSAPASTSPTFTEQDVKEYTEAEKTIKDAAGRKEVDTPPAVGNKSSEKRQENPTTLGRAVRDFNLNPSDIDGLLKSFEHFIESRRIEGQIRLMKNQREYIEKIKEKEEKFINSFKLYIQMIRCSFPGRTNFGGALITEDRSSETRDVLVDGRVIRGNVTMREYIVREIQRMEEFI